MFYQKVSMPMSENETSTIISFFLPEVWDQKYFPVSPLSSLKTKFTTQTPLTLRIPGKHLIMYQLGKRKRTCYQMMEISWRPSLTATDYKENKTKCESCFRILNKNITITQSSISSFNCVILYPLSQGCFLTLHFQEKSIEPMGTLLY